MRFWSVAFSVSFSFAIMAIGAIGGGSIAHSDDSISAIGSQPAFDRVIKTGTLRCGYIVYPPQISKDPNTGALSGLSYDIVERIGKEVGLKIDWAVETLPATFLEDLRSQKIDALCNTAWASPVRAKQALMSDPVFFTAISAFVRQDDHRFDGSNIAQANAPQIKLAVVDGSTGLLIANESFPLAALDSLPDHTDFSQLFMDVSAGKADLTFSDNAQFYEFNKVSPNKVRSATPEHPVRLTPNVFFFDGQESRLRDMFNISLAHLQFNGFIDHTLDQYEQASHPLWRRVAVPYR